MKRLFTWVLCIVLVASVSAADALAIQPANPTQRKKVPDVRKALEKLGTGPDALIAIRARDNSIIGGYLAEVGPGYLAVVDPETKRQKTVAYEEIARLHGYNLVTGAEIHQGGGVRSKIVRGLRHLLPIQPVPQNNLLRGPLIVAGIAVLVAIILLVKLT